MGDVPHYLSTTDAPPDFLFTPRCRIPLVHGEKGQFAQR